MKRRKKIITGVLLISLIVTGCLSFRSIFAEGPLLTFSFTPVSEKENISDLVVDLYRIADIEWDGTNAKYVIKSVTNDFKTDDFKEGQDVSVYLNEESEDPDSETEPSDDKTNPYTTEDHLKTVASNALGIINGKTVEKVATVPVGSTGKFQQNGLYLGVVRSESTTKKKDYIKTIKIEDDVETNVSYAYSNSLEYRFSPLLIFMLDDEKPVTLKYETEYRLGELVIEKELMNYAGRPVTFVFKVEDVTDTANPVLVDYVSLTFQSYGIKQYIMKNLPVSHQFRVTEVYSGGSYSVRTDTEQETPIKFPATLKDSEVYEESKVTFVNDFDDKKNEGYGVENPYKYGEKGWEYAGENTKKEA